MPDIYCLMLYLVTFLPLNINSGELPAIDNSVHLTQNLQGKPDAERIEKVASMSNDSSFNTTQFSVVIENSGDQINSILLSGLGGSLGGAIAGGFLSSFLQTHFSNKTFREKDHLTDLKNNVSNPLLNTVSTLSDFNFDIVRSGKITKLQSNDILLRDFMENHYPDIYSTLISFRELKLELDNKEHELNNILQLNLTNTFSSIKQSREENDDFNYKCLNTIIKAIIDDRYDESYLRITDYLRSRYLYFSSIKDDKIPFGTQKETNLLFSSNSIMDEEFNDKRVHDVRSAFILNITMVMNETKEKREEHKDIRLRFDDERKKLLDRLLEVKYSTRLRYQKTDLNKNKCSLT